MNYLLRFRHHVPFEDAESIASSFGTVVGKIPQINVVMIDCDAETAEQAKLDERVLGVSKDEIVKPIISLPNDTYAPSAWHINSINLLTAWGYSYGEGIVVASVDTGVRTTHEDLRDKLLPGWCTVTSTPNVTPSHFHGTCTAGILAASTGNGVGGVGIARDSKILPIRVTTAVDGQASLYRISLGIIYAVDAGARVISISFSGVIDDAICAAAARYARERGCVVVSGGPNETVEYTLANPDTAKDFICVSAYKSNNTRSWSWGSWIDVRSPEGVMAPHSSSDSSYFNTTGISCAIPVVAGVCALILSMRPELGFQDVKQILRQSANRSKLAGSTGAWSNLDGYGALDAGAALALAASWVEIGSDTPKVIVKSPAQGDVAFTGIATQISIHAIDSKAISSVEVYLNDVLYDTKTTAPYDFMWVPASAGAVEIKAIAYDNYQQDKLTTATSVTVVNSQYVADLASQSLALAGITPSEQFEVRAKLVNGGGDGPWSEWLTVETQSQLPTEPSELINNRVGQNLVIAHKPGSNNAITEYQVNGGAWSVVANPMSFGAGYYGQTATLGFRSSNSAGVSATVTMEVTVPNLFCVIYSSAVAGVPTASQVMLGQDPAGNPAFAVGATVASATNGENVFNILTSVPADDAYKAAFVYSGIEGTSNVVVSSVENTLNAFDERDRARALVLSNGRITQLPLGDAEKGKKPLVLLDGELKERSASEGVPIVLRQGALATMALSETLVI